MKPVKPSFVHRVQLFVITAISVITLAACSGSNDPAGGRLQVSGTTAETIDFDPQIMLAEADHQELPGTDEPPELETGLFSDESTDASIDEPSITNPVVADPMVQNRVTVTFEITVPAYQSDALKVELTWGELKLDAMWMGDEMWAATGEFPSELEHTLTVTFYDRNGDLPLAQHTQSLRTGSNLSESVLVSAAQFDTTSFDTDLDGVSNLAESIAGTDPLIDEDALLEIRNFYNLSYESRMSVSKDFESFLSEERPFLESSSYDTGPRQSGIRDVNIDADGNGTFISYAINGGETLELSGTRTHTPNTITWVGNRSAYEDYHHKVAVTNTVTLVDENTREYVEEIVASNIGTYAYTWETSTQLTGKIIEGTSLCKPTAGTTTTTFRTNPGNSVTVSTASKEQGDRYWRVSVDGRDDYFVRELRIFGYPLNNPDHAFFICDFVDFE